MGLEHLNDTEYESLKSQGLSGLNDDAYERYKLKPGYGLPKSVQAPEQKPKEEGILSKTIAGADELASRYNETINSLADKGEPVSMLLKAPSDIGNLAMGVAKKGDELLGTGPGSGEGGMLETVAGMTPQTPAQTLALAVPFHELAGKAGSLAINGVEKAGRAFESVVASKVGEVTGMQVFRDAWLSGISAARNKAKAVAEMTNASDIAQNLKNKLSYAIKSIQSGAKDSVAYGDDVHKTIDAVTSVAKKAIGLEANNLKVETKGLGVGTVEHLAPAVEEIKDDLLGVVQTSPDSATVGVLNKYLGKEVLPDNPGVRFDHKTGTFVPKTKEEAMIRVYPEADVSDLLKDRSRIGKAYVKALAEGGRGTPQSTALAKLQGIIDNEVAIRTQDSPGLLGRIEDNREAWKGFYGEFYGDPALALRKADSSAVSKTIMAKPENIDIAKRLVPELMPEVVRGEKEKLMRKMGGSPNSIQVLEQALATGRDKYSRLFSTQDLQDLKNVGLLGKEASIAEERAHKLAEEVGAAVPQRRANELSGRQRGGDPKDTIGAVEKVATSSGAKIGASGIAFMAMTRIISPGTAEALAGLGVAPSLFSAAYYAGDRKIQSGLISALKNVADFGKMASRKDQMLLSMTALSAMANSKNTPELSLLGVKFKDKIKEEKTNWFGPDTPNSIPSEVKANEDTMNPDSEYWRKP